MPYREARACADEENIAHAAKAGKLLPFEWSADRMGERMV
jgi:hypothetical protein